jgi:hypothetical protein
LFEGPSGDALDTTDGLPPPAQLARLSSTSSNCRARRVQVSRVQVLVQSRVWRGQPLRFADARHLPTVPSVWMRYVPVTVTLQSWHYRATGACISQRCQCGAFGPEVARTFNPKPTPRAGVMFQEQTRLGYMGTCTLYRGGPDLAEPNSRIGFSSDHLLCSSAGHQFVEPSDLQARVDGGALMYY